MKLKHFVCLFFALPLLWGCNDEDDINEIFTSGVWNVGNFYSGGDWHKENDGARPIYTRPEDFKALNVLTVTFLEDGTLQGKIAGNGLFTGKWSANGKDRTVSITNLKTNITPNGKSRELIDALRNAVYYKGDSRYLKLAPEDKKSYVQFGHYEE